MEDKQVSFGAKVKIWILMFIISASVFYLLTGNWQLVFGLMLMIAVHEYGHLLAAKMVGGVKTGGFYFLPIGGVSLISGYPAERWKRYIIAIGGPAIGIVLCFLGLFVYRVYNVDSLSLILKVWILINIFNLIPIYPLDGGRITFQILASIFKENTAYKIIFFITWIFTALFLFYTKAIMFLIIIIFLWRFWGKPDLQDQTGLPMEGIGFKILAVLGYFWVYYLYNFLAMLLIQITKI